MFDRSARLKSKKKKHFTLTMTTFAWVVETSVSIANNIFFRTTLILDVLLSLLGRVQINYYVSVVSGLKRIKSHSFFNLRFFGKHAADLE